MRNRIPQSEYIRQELEDWRRLHGDIPMPPQLMPLPPEAVALQAPTTRQVSARSNAVDLLQLYDELDAANTAIVSSPYQDEETLAIKLVLRNKYAEARGASIINQARGQEVHGCEVRQY